VCLVDLAGFAAQTAPEPENSIMFLY